MSAPSSAIRFWSGAFSIRISPTAFWSSVTDSAYPFVLDDARHRDHLFSAHDKGPCLALRAGHLRVDEHVLDLPAPTRQPVPWPPPPHSKSWQLGADHPLPPAPLAGDLDRPALEPEPLVLAHRLEAA